MDQHQAHQPHNEHGIYQRPGPPREFAGPGAKLYLGPLRRHYFRTTGLPKQVNSSPNVENTLTFALVLGPFSILG